MRPYLRFRHGFLVMMLVAQLLPIPIALATFMLLERYRVLDLQSRFLISVGLAVLAGLIIALVLYLKVVQPLQAIYRHTKALANNDTHYHTHAKLKGMFGEIAVMLNTASDRLQQYFRHGQAEAEVINAEANRLRYVINNIKDGVLALDKDNRVVLFNKAASQISGFSIEEAAGMPISQIMPMLRGYQLIVNEWLIQVAGEGKAMSQERWEGLRLKTKDGTERSVDVDALYQGADPNGIRALLTFHDRTQAQEIEDMKVDFVALAAHELRTPITVIRGYLEILENELGPSANPEYREYLRKLNISASQLSGFINNILHVSRIEHGNLNLRLEKSDWAGLVRAACTDLEQKAELQNKKIKLTVEENLPEVAVDKTSIVEVINNLVDNAIKYSPAGSTVEVTVRQNEDSVETMVTDHGVGIPTNALNQLFTKFYRSHRTRGSHQGTGLGLYMSKGIIEAHGGSIWVRSKEGEGSTFGFILPSFDKSTSVGKNIENSNKIVRGVHGWIKNHSLYRG